MSKFPCPFKHCRGDLNLTSRVLQWRHMIRMLSAQSHNDRDTHVFVSHMRCDTCGEKRRDLKTLVSHINEAHADDEGCCRNKLPHMRSVIEEFLRLALDPVKGQPLLQNPEAFRRDFTLENSPFAAASPSKRKATTAVVVAAAAAESGGESKTEEEEEEAAAKKKKKKNPPTAAAAAVGKYPSQALQEDLAKNRHAICDMERQMMARMFPPGAPMAHYDRNQPFFVLNVCVRLPRSEGYHEVRSRLLLTEWWAQEERGYLWGDVVTNAADTGKSRATLMAALRSVAGVVAASSRSTEPLPPHHPAHYYAQIYTQLLHHPSRKGLTLSNRHVLGTLIGIIGCSVFSLETDGLVPTSMVWQTLWALYVERVADYRVPFDWLTHKCHAHNRISSNNSLPRYYYLQAAEKFEEPVISLWMLLYMFCFDGTDAGGLHVRPESPAELERLVRWLRILWKDNEDPTAAFRDTAEEEEVAAAPVLDAVDDVDLYDPRDGDVYDVGYPLPDRFRLKRNRLSAALPLVKEHMNAPIKLSCTAPYMGGV